MSAVARLCADLSTSGVPAGAVNAVAADYACALRSRTAPAWEAFYRALFAAMAAIGPAAGDTAERARQSLMLILTDDLGSTLFAPAALERIAVSVPPRSGAARSCK